MNNSNIKSISKLIFLIFFFVTCDSHRKKKANNENKDNKSNKNIIDPKQNQIEEYENKLKDSLSDIENLAKQFDKLDSTKTNFFSSVDKLLVKIIDEKKKVDNLEKKTKSNLKNNASKKHFDDISKLYKDFINKIKKNKKIFDSKGEPKCDNWLEFYDKPVLDDLISKGYIQGTLLNKKVLKPNGWLTGSRSGRILIIETSVDSYVIKEMNSKSNFKDDEDIVKNKTLEPLEKIINKYEKDNSIDLPKFIKYYGVSDITLLGKIKYLSVMQKANGFNLASEKITPKTEKDAIDLGKSLGKQNGALTKAFYNKNKTLLPHPDTSVGNIFVDPMSKQITWIDLGGIKEIPVTTPHNKYYEQEWVSNFKMTFLKLFFGPKYYHNFPKDFKDIYISKTKYNYVEIFEKGNQDILKEFKIALKGIKSYYEAYLDQVKDLGPSKISNLDSFKTKFSELIDSYINTINKDFTNPKDALIYLGLNDIKTSLTTK